MRKKEEIFLQVEREKGPNQVLDTMEDPSQG